MVGLERSAREVAVNQLLAVSSWLLGQIESGSAKNQELRTKSYWRI
jgi:hypothetical protein